MLIHATGNVDFDRQEVARDIRVNVLLRHRLLCKRGLQLVAELLVLMKKLISGVIVGYHASISELRNIFLPHTKRKIKYFLKIQLNDEVYTPGLVSWLRSRNKIKVNHNFV